MKPILPSDADQVSDPKLAAILLALTKAYDVLYETELPRVFKPLSDEEATKLLWLDPVKFLQRINAERFLGIHTYIINGQVERHTGTSLKARKMTGLKYHWFLKRLGLQSFCLTRKGAVHNPKSLCIFYYLAKAMEEGQVGGRS